MENVENTTVTSTEEGTTTEKTYTEKELQSYADRRVSEAMKTARSKFENEKAEAERLASMTAEERYTEELNKREQALAEREKQVAILENKAAASKILDQKGLSITLVDLVLADNAEDMKARIDLLDKAFNASVQKEIERRIAGNTPVKIADAANGMTKEEFNKLPLLKQQELYKTQPELYKALAN